MKSTHIQSSSVFNSSSDILMENTASIKSSNSSNTSQNLNTNSKEPLSSHVSIQPLDSFNAKNSIPFIQNQLNINACSPFIGNKDMFEFNHPTSFPPFNPPNYDTSRYENYDTLTFNQLNNSTNTQDNSTSQQVPTDSQSYLGISMDSPLDPNLTTLTQDLNSLVTNNFYIGDYNLNKYEQNNPLDPYFYHLNPFNPFSKKQSSPTINNMDLKSPLSTGHSFPTTPALPSTQVVKPKDIMTETQNPLERVIESRPRDFDTISLHTCKWKNCFKKFQTMSDLVAHMNDIHGGKSSYVCEWNGCERHEKPFYKRHKIQTHIRIHTGERPFQCQVMGCFKRFSRLDGLQTHSQTHWNVKPFICNVVGCKKAYYHTRSLRKHQKAHLEERGVVAEDCRMGDKGTE